MVPLTRDGWAVLDDGAEVEVLSSRALGAEKLLSRALPGFHCLAFGAEVLNRRMLLADQANLQVARSSWRRHDEDEARRRLFGLFGPSPPAASADRALIAALREVGRHEGIAIRAPDGPSDRPPALSDLLHASGVRARQVRLSPEDRWWRGDSGAMLAFRSEGGDPVALVPGAMGRYRLRDPGTGASTRVERAEAATLASEAHVLYRPLPGDRPVGARELLATAAGTAGSDLARVVGAGLAAGILALAPAAGIGVLVDSVIPSGDGGALLRLALLLVLLAIAAALAHVLRGMAVMRIEGRLAARATAALWDRLLRLRARFYREYSSGEMSMRALAFQTVRDRLSGATGAALLSVLFLVPSIALVFLYDAVLGWLSMGIGLAALAVTLAFGVAQMTAQQQRFREERLLAGHLSQLIDCVRKLQAAGAEGSARASWARRYREQKLAEIRIGILNEHLTAFGAAVPLLAAAVLFAAAYGREVGTLGVGDFLVAYVASMVFYASIVTLGAAFESIASVKPACEQILPILAASPETGCRPGPPVVLAGALRFESVSFRYGDTGPPVLDAVDIHARPGEFIAIVGESGAGKSTLVRLALGLETPTGGAVYYDDRDLAHLDPVSVRRQVGAVLQDGGVQIGTVFNNIVGQDRSLTEEDAWRAARQASVDREIAAMPMQMHTSMGERAAAVSGGQRSTHPDRAGAGPQPAHRHPRRGHQLARSQEPGGSHGEDTRLDRDADRHRPPDIDDPPSRAHLRARGRESRSGRAVRRTGRCRRAVSRTRSPAVGVTPGGRGSSRGKPRPDCLEGKIAGGGIGLGLDRGPSFPLLEGNLHVGDARQHAERIAFAKHQLPTGPCQQAFHLLRQAQPFLAQTGQKGRPLTRSRVARGTGLALEKFEPDTRQDTAGRNPDSEAKRVKQPPEPRQERRDPRRPAPSIAGVQGPAAHAPAPSAG